MSIPAEELIESYFAAEDEASRDAAFEALTQDPTPDITDFLFVMMTEDEDPQMRWAACAELAKRGEGEAVRKLEEAVTATDDVWAFSLAIHTLAQLGGAGYFDHVKAIWEDAERPEEQRHVAMLLLEEMDAPATLQLFRHFIEKLPVDDDFPESLVEAIAVAFARHEFGPGKEALAGLLKKAEASTAVDTDDREELVEILKEALGLFD